METQLPTFTSAQWTVTSLLDSVTQELSSDTRCRTLRLFAYAVTGPGWLELRSSVMRWARQYGPRTVVAYVGTDHALTDPDALRTMRGDGIDVRMMRLYHGIFHPKVLWLVGDNEQLVWVGSNNLTREGLLHNVEFATLIKSAHSNPDLEQWFQGVHGASDPLDDALLNSYEFERRNYAAKRANAATFTWSRRDEAPGATGVPQRRRRGCGVRSSHLSGQTGDLVVEVMPRETGLDGKQMQLPKDAAVQFFGLRNRVGSSKQVTLKPVGQQDARTLTMTLFGNNTARLSITELDYRDRPCVLVFHPQGHGTFAFEIVQQSIFPGRYRGLISRCSNQTRADSRRWTIL